MTFLGLRKILIPFWILFVVSTAQRILKDADLHYTCDESGLHLKIKFDSPFKGLLYVKGYPLDSKCRLPLPRYTTEASFTVPLMACDTVVRQRPETNPWIVGSLVFQQNPLVSTEDDFTKSFICAPQKDTEAPWTEVIKEAYDNMYTDSERKGTFLMGSWLDFKLLPDIVSEEQKASFKRDRSYLFIYVNDGRHFNDMVVTDCIAHKERILLRNSSVIQMTNPNGCSNTSTKTLSGFKVMRNNNGFIVGVYSEINPVQIQSLENSFVSCLAVLCKHKCKCTKNSSPKGHVLIHTNNFRSRISKRSITEPPFSVNKTRSIFMKSTMKALAERLKKYRNQSKMLQNETDFEKRTSSSEDKSDETTLSFDSTDQYTTEFTTEISEDFEDHDSNTESIFVNVSTRILPEEEVEDILTNMVEDTTTIKSTFATTVGSNDQLLDNYTITLIPDVEFEKKYNLIEQSTINTSLNDNTTSKVLEESTQNPQDVLSTNVTTETKGQVANMTTKAEESHLDQNCTSKLKFVVVTSVLSFVIFCLILVSCGLALYLKKEKKKHKIDSYLLYNFY